MMRFVLGLSVAMICASSAVHAGEIRGVKFDDQMKVGETSLQLNGMGLRTIRKFGIPVKVYVAGLYTSKKVSAMTEMLALKEPKVIVMEFLHSVISEEQMQDSYRNSIKSACSKSCDKVTGPSLKQFLGLMTEMRKGQRMILEFWPDHVKVAANGRKPKEGRIDDADFAETLLSVFTGPNTKATDIRDGLLGLSKP